MSVPLHNDAQEQVRFQALLLDQVRNAVIATDLAGAIIFWNQHAETMYQWKAHEVLGKNIAEVTVPEQSRDHAEKIIARLPEGHWEGEFVCRRKDGSTLPVYVCTSVFYDDTGAPAGLVGISTDSTKRKQVEAELITRNLQLNEAQALAQLGSWDWDLVNDQLTWSDELYRLFGIQRGAAEVTSEVVFSHFHPEDRPLVESAIAEALAGRAPYNVEFRVPRSDHAVRYFHAQGQVTFDLENRPLRMVGVVQDITARKAAEQELLRQARRSEAMLRTTATMAQHLKIGRLLQTICTEAAESLDAQVSIIYVYEESGNLLRYAADIGLNTSAHGFTIPCDLLGMGPNCEQLPAVLDSRHPAFGGENNSIFGELAIQPVVLSRMQRAGKLLGVLGLLRLPEEPSFKEEDLQLLQSFADQAAFAVANAQLYDQVSGSRKILKRLSAHLMLHQELERRKIARELHDEMGQAMTALKINLQALQHYPDPPNLHSRLEDSVAVVDRLLQQVRSLSLDLHPPLLEDFGLERALEWYVTQCRQRTGLKISFTCDVHERFAPALEISCFRVAQEAITNVIRHAKAERVVVSLRRTAKMLELLVQDDGVGFDGTAMHTLAERGKTMGWVSMSERVAFTGGRLEWDSKPGSGTLVHARFPISVAIPATEESK